MRKIESILKNKKCAGPEEKRLLGAIMAICALVLSNAAEHLIAVGTY